MAAVSGFDSLMRHAWQDLATRGRVQVAGSSESLTQLILLTLMTAGARPEDVTWTPRKLVVVLPTAKELGSWLAFTDQAAAYPGALLPYLSLWGNDRFINPSLARRQRVNALSRLAGGDAPAIVVTTLMGLGQLSLGRAAFRSASLRIAKGEEHDQDQLVAALEDLGYTRAQTVEEEATFAVRGGIVDVWPPSESDPARIEFIGDTVDSLRFFAATDQKSRHGAAALAIPPAYEALTPAATRKEDAQTLFNALLEQRVNPADRDGMLKAFQLGVRFPGFDLFGPLFRPESQAAVEYLDGDGVVVFPSGIESCLARYQEFYEAAEQAGAQDQAKGRPGLPAASHFLAPQALAERLEQTRYVELGNPYSSASVELYRLETSLIKEGAPPTHLAAADLFDRWARLFEEMLKKGEGAIAIVAHHDEQLDRIRNLLDHRDLPTVTDPTLFARIGHGDLPAGRIYLGKGELASHVWLEDRGLLVVPDPALFGGRPRKHKPASAKLQNYLSSFADLKVSDLVVHVQHGIGRYQGMTSLAVAGVMSDFLIIEYAGGDKIYLPVDRLSLLQRYSAGTEGQASHALDKLGGPGWEKRKSKVKGAIKDMAEQLLKVQAKRALARGHAFGAADDSYLQFEAAFPYEETEDQLRTIHDVDADLRSGKPMDRLVCGDVGFGKTEVALRAAMRTVLEGFQTLVLVPTTVLCYQHYRTFRDRLEKHGVKVAQVNRFVKAPELKAALEGVENGTVDVLIGTHRLLSKDVKPRRLGLLVVDEEQRFGVTHKEKLKGLRAGAHVLTLTATPIPRTLHMAMVGLRDISIIATPPQDRLSVRTYIARFDETLIREAIEQEVARGGQVFFVHNRVDDIEEMRLFLKSLVPHLEVRVGHGQMREQELEGVIVDFLEQKFHVLLCTTIIESGIDMPNVNSLIVNRADRFGLAQLYQLRGRVGRSSAQAYAYFLTPPEDRLPDEARERLAVLAAYQELGAGFQIASHDLELRGAGNLLGGEQSGHAAAVGLELYTEMLDGAIQELRGKVVDEKVDAEIKIPVAAVIPKAFIASENQRLSLYKSLFGAETEDDLRALRVEVEDRFGKLPPELVLLFKVARLKQLLRQIGCIKLTAGKDVYELRFAQLKELQIDHMIKAVRRKPETYRLTPDYRLLLAVDVGQKPDGAGQDKLLMQLLALITPLAQG
jgi:transcription-repair coupling factor (superfamily II helicase)